MWYLGNRALQFLPNITLILLRFQECRCLSIKLIMISLVIAIKIPLICDPHEKLEMRHKTYLKDLTKVLWNFLKLRNGLLAQKYNFICTHLSTGCQKSQLKQKIKPKRLKKHIQTLLQEIGKYYSSISKVTLSHRHIHCRCLLIMRILQKRKKRKG